MADPSPINSDPEENTSYHCENEDDCEEECNANDANDECVFKSNLEPKIADDE